MDSFSVLARNLSFLGTSPDSTICRYSNGFYHFPVLILTVFRYSLGIFLFRELARILPFSILARILPFSGTHRDSFLVLARILRFPGTRPDSTIFRDSHGFYHFPVHIWTVFRYSLGIFLFRELVRILPFFDTRTDSTIFRYSEGQFFGTRTDSTFSGYSP